MSTDAATTGILPPGVSAAELDTALDEIEAILGPDAVRRAGESAEFRDPYDVSDADEHWPSAVVQPGSVEDLQAVLRIANRRRIALWTSSQGRNNGYGGSAPVVKGSVVVSLRRMNRILEIDEKLGYVVVEPGVTFYDLVEELQRRGGRWWPSTPDLGWGSVVGNSVDHGWGYTEYGDHAAAVRGMEVVLPDGEVVRTGMWAGTSGRTAHVHSRGFGPSVDSLFMQSNLGIVTKLGRVLSPRPEIFAPLSVRGYAQGDLPLLIDATRTLMLEGTIRNVPVVGGVLGAASMRRPRAGWLAADERITEDVYRRIMAETGLGWWNLRAAFYGPAEIVDAQLRRAREVYEAAVPGVEIVAQRIRGEDVSEETVRTHPDRVQAGRPSQSLLSILQWHGEDGGHLELAPVAPLVGGDSERLNDIFREEAETEGFDFWPSIAITPRSQIYLGVLVYERTPDRVAAAYRAYERLISRFGAAGYRLYRGHVRGMDLIQDQYDWNDHAMRRFVEGIKDSLDPNGVLSPGKQGIWPERYRDLRAAE